MPGIGISALLSMTEMSFHFYFAEVNHRTTRFDSLRLLVPPVSHILEFAYVALLTDLCNSFYLESKLPALSSTLYLTLMITAALFANEKGN